MPANSYGVRDANMKGTKTLPNGAAAVVLAAGLDLMQSARADFVAKCEVLLSSPAFLTAEAPDTRTLTYDIIHSDNADLSSPVTIAPGVLVITGAGGVGAAAATFRWAPPTNVKRYIGFRATGGTSWGNTSAKSATLEVLF